MADTTDQHATQRRTPLNLLKPYSTTSMADKTIIITGGASGIGASLATRWAFLGSTIIIGDIQEEKALALVASLRQTTGKDNVHFIRCDTSSWESQTAFFQEAVTLSPHGVIDAVVVGAAIASTWSFEGPTDLDKPNPPRPNTTDVNVNIIGTIFTVHCALFWLRQALRSTTTTAGTSPPAASRDRHILLMGSMASLGPAPGAALYSASKHAILGLFRSLRATAPRTGIRLNLVMPYFVDTPLVATPLRILAAGSGLAEMDDVVEACSRVMADETLVGRSLCVGPRLLVDGGEEEGGEMQASGTAAPGVVRDTQQTAIWEVYADDALESTAFYTRYMRLLDAHTTLRGWVGWTSDIAAAIMHAMKLK